LKLKGDWCKIHVWPDILPDANNQRNYSLVLFLHALTDSHGCYYQPLINKKVFKNPTSASAVLQDANPTIQSYDADPNSERPPSHGTQFQLPHCNFYIAHPGSNAAAVTPREPNLTKISSLQLVVELVCKVSRRYLFPPLRNP